MVGWVNDGGFGGDGRQLGKGREYGGTLGLWGLFAEGMSQHKLNQPTHEWSICAVSKKQLNFNGRTGHSKKKKENVPKRTTKRKRDAKKQPHNAATKVRPERACFKGAGKKVAHPSDTSKSIYTRARGGFLGRDSERRKVKKIGWSAGLYRVCSAVKDFKASSSQ